MLAKKLANGTGCWNVLLNNWMGVGWECVGVLFILAEGVEQAGNHLNAN